MKILAIAQTEKELALICERANLFPGVEFSVLRLGKAALPSSGDMTPDLSLIKSFLIRDLNVDDKKIWNQYKQLERKFRKITGNSIGTQIHLVSQIDFESDLFAGNYARIIVNAALDNVIHERIYIPPRSAWDDESELCVRNLQAIVYEESKRRKHKLQIHLTLQFYFFFQKVVSVLYQILQIVFLVAYDIKRILLYFFSPVPPVDVIQNAVLIVNANLDLTRQFDLQTFVGKSDEKCLVWDQLKDEIFFLEDFVSNKPRVKGIDVKRISRSSFPTLAIKFAKNYINLHFFSFLAIKDKSTSIELKSHVSDRLGNWRRISYAARLVSKYSDVFSVLQPKLLVASDSIDTSRASALSARSKNIKILATSHGINLFNEPLPAMVALGDVHCIFSQDSGSMIGEDLQAIKADRIVAHDSFIKLATKDDGFVQRDGRRLLILTSPFITSNFKNWTNEIFVNLMVYFSSFEELIRHLGNTSPEIEIIIKSHPIHDHHEFYDEIRKRYHALNIRHWREPIDPAAPVPVDLVILFNSVSTLTLSIISQGLPVIGCWNALTSLALSKIATLQLYGSDDLQELVEIILKIINSRDGEDAEEAKINANKLFRQFIEPTDKGLTEMVSIALGT